MNQHTSSNGVQLNKKLVEAGGVWTAEDLLTEGCCPLCSSEEHYTVVTRQDGLPIQECTSCGLAYVNPRPSSRQLAEYYGNGYFSGARDFFKGKDYCLERDKAIAEHTVTGYEDVASNLVIEGKVILDVGCASGALLQALSKHSPKELIGVDTAECPVEFGKSKYHLDLRCETLESARFPDQYFDLVTLIDVIEHIEDLRAFVSELGRVAKPGGHVFVSTPNYFAYRLAKNEWSCLHQDFEHLQYFSPESLSRLFGKPGFEIGKCWQDSLPFRIREYPSLRRYRAHQVIHPGTALMNGWLKMKFRLLGNSGHDGLIMKAIVCVPAS
ncbi:MAG: methyltransferase domain-containing protein [Pyrinomonadaceae bacterium]